MNAAVKILLSLTLSGSILAVIIFAMKPFIKQKLSKSIQYYIWIVVLLRLALPFSFETNIMNELFYGNAVQTEISSQVEAQKASGTEQNIVNSQSVINDQGSTVNVEGEKGNYFQKFFKVYALYIWLIGTIIVLSINLIGYARFLKYLKQGNKSATIGENKILTTLLNGRHNVTLKRNCFSTTPMLIGIIRPNIIIPDIEFNETQLKNVLQHEIVHLKRFDIGVKWLTMVVTSLHWFNPLMHFIKKDINSSCELACDEAVIRTLSPTEKQDYGDTLISIVAQNKSPMRILGATMLDEKKGLKERLLAIMNHTKKSRLIMIFSAVLLVGIIFGSLYLGVGIRTGKDTPPDIYINAEDQETKVALRGGYSWNYRDQNIIADSAHPTEFKYKADNTVSLIGKQQLIIGTQKLKSDKKYDFTLEKISVYKDGKLIEFESVPPSFTNGSLYLSAPQASGEYIYDLKLNFKDRGIVEYGFVARVDMLTYNLDEISKYKTAYIGDNSKVSSIVNQIPVPDNYFKQQYISVSTDKQPYNLNVFYEGKEGIPHTGDWPIEGESNTTYSNMSKNALVLFCMIDNLDEVTFAFRDLSSDGKLEEAKYDTTYIFKRGPFEDQYGDLSVLGGRSDLLQDYLKEQKAKT